MPRSRKRDLPVRIFAVLAMAGVVIAMWDRPAMAATAPFCDERGATVLAAPPALPATDETISRGRAAPCRNGAAAMAGTLFAAPTPGHTAPDAFFDPADAATLALPVTLPPASPAPAVHAPRADGASPGVRSRVERPPRA
jgi:hypothetical protein